MSIFSLTQFYSKYFYSLQKWDAPLHGLYILEYRNDELWYDVHPIVTQVLRQKDIIS